MTSNEIMIALALSPIIGFGGWMVIGGLYDLLKTSISAIYWDIQDARAAMKSEETETIPAPIYHNDQEPVSIQDAEALAFISSHPAMRFHRKTA